MGTRSASGPLASQCVNIFTSYGEPEAHGVEFDLVGLLVLEQVGQGEQLQGPRVITNHTRSNMRSVSPKTSQADSPALTLWNAPWRASYAGAEARGGPGSLPSAVRSP